MNLFRRNMPLGVKPNADKNRILCSNCVYHSSVVAGWTYDRCGHAEADNANLVRNEGKPTCWEIRLSESQCGETAKWFKAKTA